jgi:hypothetical protein
MSGKCCPVIGGTGSAASTAAPIQRETLADRPPRSVEAESTQQIRPIQCACSIKVLFLSVRPKLAVERLSLAIPNFAHMAAADSHPCETELPILFHGPLATPFHSPHRFGDQLDMPEADKLP